MKDKIIVITGATRGLGLRLKEDLSKDNVVVTLSRSEVENGKTAFRADVSDFDDVKRVFDEIGKIYGKIDVLINNAGYGLSGATEIMKKEEIERITNVNFLGAIWCTKRALPYMTKGAKIAVDAAGKSMKRVWTVLYVPCPYTFYDRVKLETESFGGIIRGTEFGAEVELEILFPEAQAQPFLQRLTDMTSGTVEGMETGQEYRAFPIA